VQSVRVTGEQAAAMSSGAKDFAATLEAAAGPSGEAKLRVQYLPAAPPPSPVAEEGEATPGRDTPSAAGPLPELGRAEAALAQRERAGLVEERSKLARELAGVKTERDALQRQLAGSGAVAARARAAVPFTLLHLLLTALIAFCLGRYV
jgi:hypothetical protein